MTRQLGTTYRISLHASINISLIALTFYRYFYGKTMINNSFDLTNTVKMSEFKILIKGWPHLAHYYNLKCEA